MERNFETGGRYIVCPLCGGGYINNLNCQDHAGDVLVCKKCGIFFRYPQPDKATLVELYKTSYLASNIETQQTHMSSPSTVLIQMLEFLQNHFGGLQGRSLLDYGCSTGAFATLAKQAGMSVAGIEFDDSARSYARESGIDRVYKDIGELKRAEATSRFDIVTSIEVVEHLYRPWDDLECLADLLSEKGCVFITTPNARGLNARLMRGRWREVLKPTHLYWFNYDSLKLACNQAGLSDVCRVRYRCDSPGQSAFRRIVQMFLQYSKLDGNLRVIARK